MLAIYVPTLVHKMKNWMDQSGAAASKPSCGLANMNIGYISVVTRWPIFRCWSYRYFVNWRFQRVVMHLVWSGSQSVGTKSKHKLGLFCLMFLFVHPCVMFRNSPLFGLLFNIIYLKLVLHIGFFSKTKKNCPLRKWAVLF